jgi:hypothetical protein
MVERTHEWRMGAVVVLLVCSLQDSKIGCHPSAELALYGGLRPRSDHLSLAAGSGVSVAIHLRS